MQLQLYVTGAAALRTAGVIQYRGSLQYSKQLLAARALGGGDAPMPCERTHPEECSSLAHAWPMPALRAEPVMTATRILLPYNALTLVFKVRSRACQ